MYWRRQEVERYFLLENSILQHKVPGTYYSERDPPRVESQYVAHSPDTAQEVGQGKEQKQKVVGTFHWHRWNRIEENRIENRIEWNGTE